MFKQQISLIFFEFHLALNIELLVGQRLCIADAVLPVMGIRNRPALLDFIIANATCTPHRRIAPLGRVGIWTLISTLISAHKPDHSAI